MGILENIVSATLEAAGKEGEPQFFRPWPPSGGKDESRTSNPYEVDAYGAGGSVEDRLQAKLDRERFMKDRDAAKKEADSVQTQRFDNGTTVEVCNKGNNSTTFVITKNNAYATTAKSNKDFAVSFRNDGATVSVDRVNGSKMTEQLTDKGFCIDTSDFRPHTERKMRFGADSGGNIDIDIATDGRTHIRATHGNVAENSIFIKCRDGGIRTNDRNGNLVLADPRDLPRDMSRADKKAHAAFLKTNPSREQVESQGVPNPTPYTPYIPPRADQSMQAAPPQQTAPKVTAQSVINALQDPNSNLSRATAGLRSAIRENAAPQQAQRPAQPAPQQDASASLRPPPASGPKPNQTGRGM